VRSCDSCSLYLFSCAYSPQLPGRVLLSAGMPPSHYGAMRTGAAKLTGKRAFLEARQAACITAFACLHHYRRFWPLSVAGRLQGPGATFCVAQHWRRSRPSLMRVVPGAGRRAVDGRCSDALWAPVSRRWLSARSASCDIFLRWRDNGMWWAYSRSGQNRMQ